MSAACPRPSPPASAAAGCPARRISRRACRSSHKMVTGGMPFLLGELAAEAGAVRRGRRDPRQACAARSKGARRSRGQSFAGLDFTSHRLAPFLWMKLPEPWLSTTFKNAAANEGVLIDDEDEYKPGRTGADPPPHPHRLFGAADPPGGAERLLDHSPPDRPGQCRRRPLWVSLRTAAVFAGCGDGRRRIPVGDRRGVRLGVSGRKQPVERRHQS